ncbi:MAG: 5'-methylthioadenosine/adenosylhomocysteine nucleosidase [Bacteroidaceae bacterium]|nr:5'-methylthioadenosine/adenosylhomocysteine nucleosidase [Bacteroidaceae bacterium]
MKIGVIVAMTVEFDQLARLMEDVRREERGGLVFTTGRIGDHEVVLLQCGIGKVNAAMGATLMIEHYGPGCIVSTGCAGGIDAGLEVMDVVVSCRLVYHDVDCGVGLCCEPGQVQGLPRFFDGDARLVDVAMGLHTPTRIHAGLICTGDQFITSRQSLDAIKTAFPDGLAVDMESAAIAQVCHIQGVPFVSFRIISDTPGAKGHQQQYENFWEEMADRSFGVTREFLQHI